MSSPLHPDVFPKVLRNYVAMANIYAAVSEVIPANDPDKGDARRFVDRLAPDALNDVGLQLRALVAELDRRGSLAEFRRQLMVTDPNNYVLENILADSVPVDDAGRLAEAAVQSIRNRIEPFLDSKLFFDAMPAARHRVCAIAVDGMVEGSGFLIGPDLVMTARHVLDSPPLAAPPLIRRIPAAQAGDEPTEVHAPGSDRRLSCIFDYMGLLISTFPRDDPPKGVLIADVAANWLAWSSQRHPHDGIGHLFPDPPSITKRLDCAIIRLAERVGEMATDRSGRNIRGWLHLDEDLADLSDGQVLALLQYPARSPQKFGSGTYKAAAAGRTRLWYSTEAAGGSSGAPCFDSQCRVVAFHNAGRPSTPEEGIDTKLCNQGVFIVPVISALPEDLLEEVRNASAPSSSLWSVGEGDEIHPLLGRGNFCSWIAEMSGPAPAKRVIVVEEAETDHLAGNSGKSFSTRILRTVMRGRPGLVIEFEAKAIKAAEPDAFLKALAAQAGLAIADNPPPPKPVEERQLTRWWANDLPNWFAGLVEDGARASGAASRDLSSTTGEEELVLAPIWIVIDDIHKNAILEPMRECLAGMIGITESTTTLPPGLRALRWLVIGHVPDFVRERAIEYERETISQRDIGRTEWDDCCRAAFRSKGLLDRYAPGDADGFYDFAHEDNETLSAFAQTKQPSEGYLARLAVAARRAISLMINKAMAG